MYNESSPILTPRLDQLARSGALLTNFYTASPTCTASRAALLTGESKISPHATLFFEYENFAALHWGNWKIIRENPDEMWQLYNLMDDQGETLNRAEERMDLVKKLSEAFTLRNEEIENYLLIEPTFINK